MPKDNVIEFSGMTKLPIPVSKVLREAQKTKLTDVIVMGWDENGDLYVASSACSAPEILWLIDRGKNFIFG